MRVEVVRESEKLLQLPRICRFGKICDPIQLRTGEMASVLTDCVPEILYLGQTHPALFGVELDVRAAAPNVHLAIVVAKLFLGRTVCPLKHP